MKDVLRSLESFFARHAGLLSLFVVLIVAALGFLLDLMLLAEGLPRRDLRFLSNVVIGIVAGGLFYQFARHERYQRQIMRERMSTVAELNHHIRNALQVIRYAGGSKTTQDATQLQLINEAVARIEWALRSVLPRFPHGSPSSPTVQSDSGQGSFSPSVVDDFILRHKEIRPHQAP